MAYFREDFKGKQIDSIQRSNKCAQTENTFNELDTNILKERIKLLEIENDKLRKEIATLKEVSKPLNGLKDNKTLVTASPVKQNVQIFNNKHKGCSCKGNCANKICGCMKKDLQCNEACKCNARLCKNKLQELNKENYCAPRQDPLLNDVQRNPEISILRVKEKHPTESVSSVDDIFYDASEPDLENFAINLDAVRKLTFNTDEDTPEKENQLSAIQENDEQSSQSQEQKEEQVKKLTNNKGKIQKDRKGSSSSQINAEQNADDTKLNKTRRKSVSSKETAMNAKKQRKGSKSKRTASIELETEEKIPEELIENPKVNSRSRRLRGMSQNEEQGEKKDEKKDKQIKNKVPKKVKPVAKTQKDVSETLNLQRNRASGLTSSRESISNIKLPKNWRNVRSSVSLEKIGEATGQTISRNTRSKKNQGNSFKTNESKATRAVSNEETSLEPVQSRVRGLRRSISINEIEAPRAATLNRSISSDTLSKKSFKKLISKVSLSFRKSKSVDIEENTSKKNSLHVSQNFTNIKETGNELNATLVPKEIADKNLQFDPMQPTRELSRSPIPAITVSQTPEAEPYGRYSPPLYGRYFNQQEIKVGSPPPEILQDLRKEEVDPETFNPKLIECRKCKRTFFPHRIQLHEAVCHKY